MSGHFMSIVFSDAAHMFFRPTIRWTVKSVYCKGKVSVLQVPSNVSLDERGSTQKPHPTLTCRMRSNYFTTLLITIVCSVLLHCITTRCPIDWDLKDGPRGCLVRLWCPIQCRHLPLRPKTYLQAWRMQDLVLSPPYRVSYISFSCVLSGGIVLLLFFTLSLSCH